MPVATTTAAGRAVHLARHDVTISTGAEHVLNQRERLAAAKRAKDALNGTRADTTTPLVGTVPLETIPEPPAAEKAVKGTFSLSTTIEYRGRAITISASGITIDQFCNLLDERQYHAPLQLAAPLATADDLPEGYKLCKKHGAPMKPRSKQGDIWNSHNVGTTDAPCWCKGYRGPDSPGYEVD